MAPVEDLILLFLVFAKILDNCLGNDSTSRFESVKADKN